MTKSPTAVIINLTNEREVNKMFEMFVGLGFDEVVEKVAQLDGLMSVDREYGSVWYTPSEFGWESDDTYEFLFEDDICVGVEVDLYEED